MKPAAPVTSQVRALSPDALLHFFVGCHVDSLSRRVAVVILRSGRPSRAPRSAPRLWRAPRRPCARAAPARRAPPGGRPAPGCRAPGKRNPFSPGRTISAAPPICDSTTGRPSAIASSAASEKVSTEVLGSAIASLAASSGRTSWWKPAISTSAAMPRSRARASITGRIGPVADEQRARRHAARAQLGDRLDQLQVVLLRAEHRAHADHIVVVGQAEHAAHARARLGARRAPVLRVDAVVDHAVGATRDQPPQPVAALRLADEHQALGAPEERPVVEHLQPFLGAGEQRGVEGDERAARAGAPGAARATRTASRRDWPPPRPRGGCAIAGPQASSWP